MEDVYSGLRIGSRRLSRLAREFSGEVVVVFWIKEVVKEVESSWILDVGGK